MTLHVDLSNLRKFGETVERVAPELTPDFLLALEAGGELVAAEARRNARAFPRKGGGTSRIEDSIRVRKTGRTRTTVKVQAGGSDAPEAAPLEHHGLGGTFRHPTPQGEWVSQPARPFLTPAVDAKIEEVVALTEGAVDITIARIVS